MSVLRASRHGAGFLMPVDWPDPRRSDRLMLALTWAWGSGPVVAGARLPLARACGREGRVTVPGAVVDVGRGPSCERGVCSGHLPHPDRAEAAVGSRSPHRLAFSLFESRGQIVPGAARRRVGRLPRRRRRRYVARALRGNGGLPVFMETPPPEHHGSRSQALLVGSSSPGRALAAPAGGRRRGSRRRSPLSSADSARGTPPNIAAPSGARLREPPAPACQCPEKVDASSMGFPP